MSTTENNQPRFNHESPGVSGYSSRQAWRDVRASLTEMVEACEADPFFLERDAQSFLSSLRWPDGVRCPSLACSSEDVQEAADHGPMPYLCQKCRRPFCATSATILSSIKLGCLQLVAAAYVSVEHHGLVTARPLAEWLETDERTARLLLELIRKVIAGSRSWELPAAPINVGDTPTTGVGDAVELTRRVLAVILGGDRNGAGGVIATTGGETDWHSVLPLLDPVRLSQSEPRLPGMELTAVPRPLAVTTKKTKPRQPRKPRVPEPNTRGMRPDQPELRWPATAGRHRGAE